MRSFNTPATVVASKGAPAKSTPALEDNAVDAALDKADAALDEAKDALAAAAGDAAGETAGAPLDAVAGAPAADPAPVVDTLPADTAAEAPVAAAAPSEAGAEAAAVDTLPADVASDSPPVDPSVAGPSDAVDPAVPTDSATPEIASTTPAGEIEPAATPAAAEVPADTLPAGAATGEGADPVADAGEVTPSAPEIKEAIELLARAGVEVSAAASLAAIARAPVESRAAVDAVQTEATPAAVEAPAADAAAAEVAPAADTAPAADAAAAPAAAEGNLADDILEDLNAQATADEEIKRDTVAAEALDEVVLAMESSAGVGGMNRQSAKALGIAVDAIYRMVGLSDRAAVPALESFGGVSSRISATKTTAEGISEQAKRLRDRIAARKA
jgi:hypothetical protein